MCASNKNGFTIVELVISIALLSLMFFGISELFSRGLSAARRAEHVTVAAYLGQAQLEVLLSAEYPDITPGIYEERHRVFEAFERETTVDYLNPDDYSVSETDQGLKRITTVVYYPHPIASRSIQFSTIVNQ